ncbi:MAG: SBBP repeat-containing protein [Bacteroidota bacterium]|nr:SBBP repeat-containing protein [Bacteroidota bacterium]
MQWVARYNGPSIGYSTGGPSSVAVDGSGNVYVTGRRGVYPNYDYATIKYNSSGVQQWVQVYNGVSGGNYNNEAFSIAVDDSGNVYVTGQSAEIGFYNNYDYATIKYNTSGIQQWVRIYNGPGNDGDVALSLAVDGSGNVYVTGYSWGGSLTSSDYATIKYNSSGVQQWVHRYNGPAGAGNNSDFAWSLTVDGSGNVYVTGKSDGNGTGSDYATIKYNSSGVQQWVQRYNGPANGYDAATARSLAVDSSGNVYVTGESTGIGTALDYATIKYNSFGVQQWVQRYSGLGSGYDRAYSIVADVSGNVIVTGESAGSGGISDYATIKYNSNGDSLWIRRYNGPGNNYDVAGSLAVDGSGNVYVTGSSDGSGTGRDYATIKYNSSGVQQWIQRYNEYANGNDGASSLAVDGSGNVYVTGFSISDYATIKYSENITRINITIAIGGFYDILNNRLNMKDTVETYLRSNTIPYSIVDSAKALIDSTSFTGNFFFDNAPSGTYYIVLKHRNSIETWSKSGGENLTIGTTINYNFTTANSQAFGNNMILKGTKYCIYSGDVNQGGTVDLSDLSLIDNDLYNFVSGYFATDLSGDNFVDLNDATIADNNAFNFVSLVRP